MRSDLHAQGRALLPPGCSSTSASGTQRVVAYVLRENDAMRTLALDGGFVIDARKSDPDTVTLVKTLRPRSAPAKASTASSL